MVPKFGEKGGLSFKGLVQYLTHDAGHAETDQRVAWTHTLNLAHDHVPSALHEMYTTVLDADLLKAEAGIRNGTKVERPVKHVSLNWHPSETPDRGEMIATAEAFLKHMDWQDHQAILVSHDDTPHRHVHLVISAIHPETGRKLDDGFEKRRAQKWAAAYEAERGQVFCPQRQFQAAEREASAPRPQWIDMREHTKAEQQKEAGRLPWDGSYMAREENRLVLEHREWQILKDVQKEERLAFFAGGKAAYGAVNRAVYRKVREGFRDEWSAFYAAKRKGADKDELAETKSELVARQKEVFEERRETATAELRAARDLDYRALLDGQQQQRADLVDRQEQNLRSPQLLDRAYPSPEKTGAPKDGEALPVPPAEIDALDRFGIRRGRGEEGTERLQRGSRDDGLPQFELPFATGPGFRERPPARDIAAGLAGGLLSVVGNLGESLWGGQSKKPKAPEPDPEALDRFSIQRGRAADADREREARDKQVYDDSYWEWRKRKREMDR